MGVGSQANGGTTYENPKVVMCTEYVKFNGQDATTARATGHASAHSVEEFAQATEELVAEFLTEKHAKQIKTLSKAMQQLTAAINSNGSNGVSTPSAAAAAAPAARTPSAAQSTKAQLWAKGKEMQKHNSVSPLQQDASKPRPAPTISAGTWKSILQNAQPDGRWVEQGALDEAKGP